MVVHLKIDSNTFPETFGITVERHKEIWNAMCKIVKADGPHEHILDLIKLIESLPKDNEKLAAMFSLGTMLGEERATETVKRGVATKLILLAKMIVESKSQLASADGKAPEENDDDEGVPGVEVYASDDKRDKNQWNDKNFLAYR